METRYAASIAILIAVIGMYGLVTMQPLAALLLIAVILGVVFAVRFFDATRQSLDRIERRLEVLEKK
jgi:hypothetical protein